MAFDPNIRRLNVGQEFQSGLSGWADWGGVFPTSYVENMIQRWVDAGITHVAFACPGLSNDWVRDTLVPIHLQIIEMIMAAGIGVQWGAACAGGTNFQKVDYWLNHGNLEDHLAAFQSLVDTYDVEGEWVLGNENAPAWNRDLTQKAPTFDRVSNIATVTTTYPHNLAVGDSLTIDGVYGSITEIVNDTTFRQNNVGANVSKVNVSCPLSETSVGRIMSRAGAYLKSLDGITVPMVYRCSQGKFNGTNYYFELMNTTGGWWASDYLASIDKVYLNAYGEGGSDAARLADFKAHIDRLAVVYAADMSRTGVTEYGLGADDSLVPRSDLASYYSYWKQRIDHIETKLGLKHYIFANNFPDNGGRNHLSMTQPVRYDVDIEHQPIYDYFLDQEEQSVMLLAYTQPSNLMQYSLVNKNFYTATPAVNELGYLSCPGTGADARKISSVYNFQKTKSYGWMCWWKPDDIVGHPVNTLIRFGDAGSNGYRILVERSGGSNYLNFQDFKTYSTQTYVIPAEITIAAFNHYTVTWEGTDANLGNWRPFFYVNGRRLIQTSGTISFAGLTEKLNGSIFVGHDWNVQNMGGQMTDLAFYHNKVIWPNDIWRAIKNREFPRASSYWPLIGSGSIAPDLINDQDLTLTGEARFYQFADAAASAVKHSRSKLVLKHSQTKTFLH